MKLSYLAHCQEIIDISSCCVLWICVYMCIIWNTYIYVCVVVVWVPTWEWDASYRFDIKKFVDAKAPLNMLKFKMQLKTEQNDAFKVFYDELDSVNAEQNKFLEKLEYQVAVAEAIDPAQAFIF